MTDTMLARRTLLTALASATLAPTFASSPAAAAPGAALRIGLAAPVTTLDPHLQSNAPNNAVASHIFDALVTNDEQLRARPGLAQSWRNTDDTHWEFILRPGVRLTDGAPFTAADAAASLQRATDLPSTASFRTYTRTIKHVDASDPAILRIETHAPDPLLPAALSRIRIVRAAFAAAPSPEFDAGRAAVGTGPFAFREYVPGSHVALARNDGWWGPKLPWPAVILRTVSEPGSRLATLLAGDLDLIEAVPAESADRLTAGPHFHLVRGTSSRLVYLGLDQRRSQTPFITGKDGQPLPRNPLLDLRVRQALDMAINRSAVVDRVMEGNAVAASQFLPTGAPGTAPGLQPTPYDHAGAKALLAEAGYGGGFNLVLHGPNNRYVNDGKIVQAVAQMFTRIGIGTAVELMPWATYAGRSPAGDFSVFLASWGVNTGETSNPLAAICATPDAAAGLGIANDAGYANPQLDTLLKQALQTMDEGARNALLSQASALAFADRAILPLHHEVGVWGLRQGLAYTPRADLYTLASNVGTAS